MLLIVGSFAMAQAPNSTPKKEVHPGYTPTWNKSLSLQINVTVGQLNNFVFVGSKGGPQAISASDLRGYEITQYNKDYYTVLDSLGASGIKAINSFIKIDQAKFTKDTTELYHPKPVINK